MGNEKATKEAMRRDHMYELEILLRKVKARARAYLNYYIPQVSVLNRFVYITWMHNITLCVWLGGAISIYGLSLAHRTSTKRKEFNCKFELIHLPLEPRIEEAVAILKGGVKLGN